MAGRQPRYIERPDDFLPTETIAELYLKWESGWNNYTDDDRMTACAYLCRILGFVNSGRADTTQLKRRLGIAIDTRTGKPSQSISYDLAVKIVKAMGYDPVDVGL